jgi:putative two-component system response regulator
LKQPIKVLFLLQGSLLKGFTMNANDQSENATILLVDDSPDNLTLMSSLLKDTYQVKIAESGENALLIALSDTPPDLILLDIMMPSMDGYEVCWRLKNDRRTTNIPVIFLTSKTDAEDERKGLELGAVDFISKPINPEVVMARVKNHISLKIKADFLQHKNDGLEIEVAKLQYTRPLHFRN